MRKRWLLGPVSALLLACSSEPIEDGSSSSSSSSGSGSSGSGSSGSGSSGSGDAGDVGEDAGDAGARALDEQCASSFGSALTAPYGRIDGTLLAVVSPGNEQCALPNGSHVVLQVLWQGEVYRLVVNVESKRGDDPDIYLRTLDHSWVGPAFAEGWHTGLSFDYATDLDVHASDDAWEKVDKPTAVQRIEDAVSLDAQISVFASTDGGSSAHLIHRNKPGKDGAIVFAPTSATPRWMLFRFAEQSF